MLLLCRNIFEQQTNILKTLYPQLLNHKSKFIIKQNHHVIFISIIICECKWRSFSNKLQIDLFLVMALVMTLVVTFVMALVMTLVIASIIMASIRSLSHFHVVRNGSDTGRIVGIELCSGTGETQQSDHGQQYRCLYFDILKINY